VARHKSNHGKRNQTGNFSSDARIEGSLRHSIKDGVYFSLMNGGAESYFSAYAISLQASTPIIGLLATMPALFASFMQVFSAWLGRRTRKRKPIIVIGALFQAACLLPLAFAPLALPDFGAVLLVPIVFLYLCGPNLGAPQWNSLVGDLLPESKRGRFFAQRTKLASVASVAALATAGLVLDAFDRAGFAYWGFVTIFLLAACARCMSAYHLSAMHEPGKKTAALEVPNDMNWWRQIRHTNLWKFSLFYAFMQFAVAISGPYFTLYMLRDLSFSYFEFMVITVASVVVQFMTLNRWGRLSDLFGNRLILITTGSLITVIPSLWLVSTNYYWILCVQALSGLSWAGFTLSATAFVFDLTPSEHRATLFAAHNVLAALAIFLGASLGAVLASQIPAQITIWDNSIAVPTPLYGLFLCSCLVRMLVAGAFLPLLKEVRRVRPMSMGGLIFRVTRMHPVSGVIYDIVGRMRKPEAKRNAPAGEEDEKPSKDA
jgi:MFS family permease